MKHPFIIQQGDFTLVNGSWYEGYATVYNIKGEGQYIVMAPTMEMLRIVCEKNFTATFQEHMAQKVAMGASTKLQPTETATKPQKLYAAGYGFNNFFDGPTNSLESIMQAIPDEGKRAFIYSLKTNGNNSIADAIYRWHRGKKCWVEYEDDIPF